MGCENCGAAMRLAESGGYQFCEYCSSLRFVSETDEGVVPSGVGVGEQCPACRVEELQEASVEGKDVSYCVRCRGILLESRVFRQIIDARRKRGCSRETPARPPGGAETPRHDCPRCGVEMSRHPYYGPGGAVIDCCGECLLLWLDHPELTVIAKAHQTGR